MKIDRPMQKHLNSFTPFEFALAAYDCWILALYIKMGVWLGDIPDSFFENKIQISEGRNRWVIIPHKEQRDMKGVSDNLVRTSQGTCFIAFDEALDDAFGEKPVQYEDNDKDSLRAIIYMFRCAFAHTPIIPTWSITKKRRQVFRIREISFEMDFRDLDGKRLDESHHAGLHALLQLMDYCLSTLKRQFPNP